jgi:hypothetical protein
MTFNTPEEALAFMLGLIAGKRASGIGAHFDTEEPEAVLIDCYSDDDKAVWISCVADYSDGFPNGH